MKEQVIQQIERLAQEAQGRIKPSMLIKDRAYQLGKIDACHKLQDIINGMREDELTGSTHSIADYVIDKVCEKMGVSRTLLMGKIRRQNVVAARMVAAMLLKEFTCMDDLQIGLVLCKSDTQAIYYRKQGDIRKEYDKGFKVAYMAAWREINDMLWQL